MLGAILSVLAALLFGISSTIQKYSLKRMRTFSISRLARDRVWVISIVIGIVGILFYIAALGVETISIVQPLLAISIIIPVVCGWLFFGENIGTKWVHIIIILLGVVLLSL